MHYGTLARLSCMGILAISESNSIFAACALLSVYHIVTSWWCRQPWWPNWKLLQSSKAPAICKWTRPPTVMSQAMTPRQECPGLRVWLRARSLPRSGHGRRRLHGNQHAAYLGAAQHPKQQGQYW